MAMHPDQLHIDAATARRLVRQQFPAWADLSVRAMPTAATVNAIFRIGDSLAARFPLRAGDPTAVREQLEREAAAAREFAAVSPVPAPDPVTIGAPGEGYPLPWSVQTWLPGQDALADDPAESYAFADDLVRLLRALRSADTRGRRFSGSGRGGHLADHEDWMGRCLASSSHLVDVAAVGSLWQELRALPELDNDVMCHGDLTPTNVLVGNGRLVGVLDTGGFAPADPALDLVSGWHLLEAGPREAVRHALAVPANQWLRGKAWALQQAMGLVWYYESSNPVMSTWGRRTVQRLLADQ